MYRTDFWTLWEKARVGYFKRTASKHVYYLGWNRSPAQVGCMRQVLGPGTLGRPRGIVWRGRWEGGLEWGIHVYPWLIHVNLWQKPLQYCKVISLQLIKIKCVIEYFFSTFTWFCLYYAISLLSPTPQKPLSISSHSLLLSPLYVYTIFCSISLWTFGLFPTLGLLLQWCSEPFYKFFCVDMCFYFSWVDS